MSDQSKEIEWNEFERRLVEEAGWSKEQAHEERLALEHGQKGDCDGDLQP